MSSPLISCLIPIFNGAEFLRLAIDSILTQSFVDFEIIIIDDGSTDDSRALLEAYAASDPRMKVFSKSNGGIVSALNFGLDRCSGKYVARMDCDDIALPDRFASQIKVFADHPDAVAVGGLIQRIDERGTIIATPISPSRVARTDLSSFPPTVANVQHSAGTFLRSAIVAVGGYRDAFPHAEDYDLYLRLAPFGKFYNPNKLVLYYRVHSKSISVQNLELQETSAVLAELSAFAREAGLSDPGDSSEKLHIRDFVTALNNRFREDEIRRYIGFRIWRRVAYRKDADSRARLYGVLAGVLSPRHYLQKADIGLNRRIVLSLGKGVVTSLANRVVGLYRRVAPQVGIGS